MYFVQHIKQRSDFLKKYLTGNRLRVEFKLLQCNIFLVLERLHPRLQNLFDHLFWRYKCTRPLNNLLPPTKPAWMRCLPSPTPSSPLSSVCRRSTSTPRKWRLKTCLLYTSPSPRDG